MARYPHSSTKVVFTKLPRIEFGRIFWIRQCGQILMATSVDKNITLLQNSIKCLLQKTTYNKEGYQVIEQEEEKVAEGQHEAEKLPKDGQAQTKAPPAKKE